MLANKSLHLLERFPVGFAGDLDPFGLLQVLDRVRLIALGQVALAQVEKVADPLCGLQPFHLNQLSDSLISVYMQYNVAYLEKVSDCLIVGGGGRRGKERRCHRALHPTEAGHRVTEASSHVAQHHVVGLHCERPVQVALCPEFSIAITEQSAP